MTQITEEMVEAARSAYFGAAFGSLERHMRLDATRAALEAVAPMIVAQASEDQAARIAEAMTLDEMAALLCESRSAGLNIYFNRHKCGYQTLAEAVVDDPDWYGVDDFVSEESRARCLRNDTCWTLQYYPKTPVGFVVIHAHSFAALVEWCKGHAEKEQKP